MCPNYRFKHKQFVYYLHMANQPPAYSRRQIVQFLSVFWVCAALCYIAAAIGGSAVPSEFAKPPMLLLPILGLVIILPLMLWFDTRVRRIRIIFHATMHLIAGSIMLLYLGSYNPLTTAWLVLCILTYMEFGFPSFVISAVFLYSVNIIFCVLIASVLPAEFGFGQYLLYSMAFCTILVLSAYVVTWILENSDRRRRELELLRKSEALQVSRLDTLLNSISDVVLTLNRYGRITSQNASALSFFDTNESLVGKSIDGLLEVQDSSSKSVNVRELAQSVKATLFRDDLSLKQADGSTVRLGLQMSRIHGTFEDEAESGVVMILRDITQQKTLEDEKDEFISVASHELRTPIAIAEGSLSNLVLMQAKGMEPSKLASAASTAHDQVLYLARMINDLSTLSRAERGVGDVAEEINVNELLEGLYKRYQTEAEVKSLHLNLDMDKLPMVTTSRLYLEEILQNFLTNSIKYTKEGSITLSGKLQKDGKIECSVSDTGIGISKTDQERIFEKFFRSEDYRTRETNGTGLGLYVVKKLADKLDTKVEVKSRLNHGSTFSFILPLTSTKLGTGKRTTAGGASTQ